jgi:hypothetical protein
MLIAPVPWSMLVPAFGASKLVRLEPQLPLACRRTLVPRAPEIAVKHTTANATAERETRVSVTLGTLYKNAVNTLPDTACFAECSDFMTYLEPASGHEFR